MIAQLERQEKSCHLLSLPKREDCTTRKSRKSQATSSLFPSGVIAQLERQEALFPSGMIAKLERQEKSSDKLSLP